MSRKSNAPGKRTPRRARPPRATTAAQEPPAVGRASVPAQAAPGAPAPQLVTHHSELAPHRRPSAVLDTRVIYCGDCLDQLQKLPDACVDLIYLDPPFNSNRNHEVFRRDVSEPRAQASGFLRPFDDRHASTQAYIDFMRPRCVELARVPKKTGSFYYHCDWHASNLQPAFSQGARRELSA